MPVLCRSCRAAAACCRGLGVGLLRIRRRAGLEQVIDVPRQRGVGRSIPCQVGDARTPPENCTASARVLLREFVVEVPGALSGPDRLAVLGVLADGLTVLTHHKRATRSHIAIVGEAAPPTGSANMTSASATQLIGACVGEVPRVRRVVRHLGDEPLRFGTDPERGRGSGNGDAQRAEIGAGSGLQRGGRRAELDEYLGVSASWRFVVGHESISNSVRHEMRRARFPTALTSCGPIRRSRRRAAPTVHAQRRSVEHDDVCVHPPRTNRRVGDAEDLSWHERHRPEHPVVRHPVTRRECRVDGSHSAGARGRKRAGTRERRQRGRVPAFVRRPAGRRRAWDSPVCRGSPHCSRTRRYLAEDDGHLFAASS